jgi:signal transduction histidine kinase
MKPTILAIDDDPIILDMYQVILEGKYNLLTAASGVEALALVEQHPRIDLILLDIMMPEMSGYEVCRKIRQGSSSGYVKIILVSSKVKLDDRLSGYRVGADDYIMKPFEESELLAKVTVFLRLKHAEEIDRIKNNFISLINHEARTPLTVIFGYAEILRESPHLSEQDRRFVDKIIESGKTLLRYSENTILLSDLKSGKVSLDSQEIDLKEFLSEHQQAFQEAAEAKELAIQLHCGPAVKINADPKLLAVAVDALIDNAVKYAKYKSQVRITAEASRERVEIEVFNEGDSIAPHRFEMIFDELAAHDIEHHHGGQRLSLPIARRIAEVHEGALSVRNSVSGPAFTLSFRNPAASILN